MFFRNLLLLGVGVAFLWGSKGVSYAAELHTKNVIEKKDETPENENFEVPEEYLSWFKSLKKEMLDKGISAKTVDTALGKNYYHPKPEVVKIDRRQIEFVLTSTDYLNRMIDANKVRKGQQKYKELYPLFYDMEEKYGVPFEYIVAFWGMETNYGVNFGKFNIIESLVQMSYDKRRPLFFREQLFEALKMIDNWGIDYTKMQGSWAGAMGHFQFMPSTINAYAIDYNVDGKIDIWHSFEDAAASAANYISKLGWQKDIPWGMEVSLPWDFDYALTGRNNLKSVAEWKKSGVKTIANQTLPLDDKLQVAIIVPEGKKGRAYLITENFKKILVWNRSENYALGVGVLSDYIKNGKKWQRFEQHPAVRIKTDDVLKIQDFINKLGLFKLVADGQLGPETREAIKKVQKQAKLPQDGYPDYQLLQKINSYNPEIGFAIPVPIPKTQKNADKK